MNMVRNPLVMAIETMALQKSLSQELLFHAMEDALASVASKSMHPENHHTPIRAHIDRTSGEITLKRVWEVVDDAISEHTDAQIPLRQAIVEYPGINVGDQIEEIIDNPDLSRIDYHQARQVLMRILREADRERVAENYRKRLNTIINGKVKRVTREYVLIEIEEGVDGMLSRKDMLDRDIFRVGDRIKSLLVEVSVDKSSLLKLSRITPEFLIELFKQEVPECSDGAVHIKAAAREPGVRAKIAVKSNDSRIDPVGACIGMRGSRIQSVTNELNGERIDIILWNDDIAQFTINALAPAIIESITINESKHSMDIAVPADQLASAIGKNGQNIKLASQLVGWQLHVMSQSQAENRQKTRHMLLSEVFKNSLDVDHDIANILIREGYSSLEEVVSSSIHELSGIQEFDEDIASALVDRAKQAILRQAISGENYSMSNLHELEGINSDIAQTLLKNNITTKDDLGELSVDELCDIIDIDATHAAALILEARREWFEGEKESE